MVCLDKKYKKLDPSIDGMDQYGMYHETSTLRTSPFSKRLLLRGEITSEKPGTC